MVVLGKPLVEAPVNFTLNDVNKIIHGQKKTIITESGMMVSIFAEKEGFEPSVQFPVRMFSKHVLSATQATLQA